MASRPRDRAGSAQRFTIAAELVVRESRGHLIVVDLKSGECFELNTTGAEIWRGLQRGDSIDSITRALTRTNNLEMSAAQAHVDGLMTALVNKALVRDKEKT